MTTGAGQTAIKTPDVAEGRASEPLDAAPSMTASDVAEADRRAFRELRSTGDASAGRDVVGDNAGSQHAGNDQTAAAANTSRDRTQDVVRRREVEAIARGVLGRDGLPPSAIDRLLRDTPTDELHAIASHRRKVQADQDRVGNQLRDAMRSTAQSTEDAGNIGDDPVRALVEHFRSAGDDRGADLLEQAMGTLAQRPGSTSDAASLAALRHEFRDEIAEVQRLYPQAKGLKDVNDLLVHADRLAKEGAFGPHTTVLDALLETAKIRLGPHRTSQRDAGRREFEIDGAPDANLGAPLSPARDMSPEELDRQAFRMLATGASPEKVSSSLRR